MTRAGRVAGLLLTGLVLAGCGSGSPSATRQHPPKVVAPPPAASDPSAAGKAKRPSPAPAIHRSFDYEIAVDDALPNSHSMVGYLHLVQAGSKLQGRFHLFYLVRERSGIFDPQTKIWRVRGSILDGSDVKLDFRRTGGNPDCLLFPCSVDGHLSRAALELKPPSPDGAAKTVRLTAGSSAVYRDRVTVIQAYINGNNEYVAGQQIEAAKWAHAR